LDSTEEKGVNDNKLYLGFQYAICDALFDPNITKPKPNCIVMSDGTVVANKKLHPGTELVLGYQQEKKKPGGKKKKNEDEDDESYERKGTKAKPGKLGKKKVIGKAKEESDEDEVRQVCNCD
jgi:hypothetical protein